MTDYVELENRLREYANDEWTPFDLMEEAADAIAALTAELQRAQEATSRALDLLACQGDPTKDHYCPNCDNSLADARVIIDVLHARLAKRQAA